MQVVTDFNDLPSPTGMVDTITGTPIFAAASTLSGGAHTLSSMCEGLLYSIIYSSSGGKLPDAPALSVGVKLKRFAVSRRGTFMCKPPMGLWDVSDGVAPLVRRLHALFWPTVTDPESAVEAFWYKENVTPQQVKDVCVQFAEEAGLELVTTPVVY